MVHLLNNPLVCLLIHMFQFTLIRGPIYTYMRVNWNFHGKKWIDFLYKKYMQFSAEKYEKQSSYVIQSTEYNNLLHVHKVRAQSEKLLKGVNIHGLTLHHGMGNISWWRFRHDKRHSQINESDSAQWSKYTKLLNQSHHHKYDLWWRGYDKNVWKGRVEIAQSITTCILSYKMANEANSKTYHWSDTTYGER